MSAPVCPECAAGKHVNCTSEALDEATDRIVACGCEWCAEMVRQVEADDLREVLAEVVLRHERMILSTEHVADALLAGPLAKHDRQVRAKAVRSTLHRVAHEIRQGDLGLGSEEMAETLDDRADREESGQ